jgi:hypothetical protein
MLNQDLEKDGGLRKQVERLVGAVHLLTIVAIVCATSDLFEKLLKIIYLLSKGV